MMRILKCALLLGIGYVFATAISMLGAKPLDQMEILFLCGFPAGWVFTGKHFGHMTVEGSFIAWLFFWVIKILVGSVIGWGVLAVDVIRGLGEMLAAPFVKHREEHEEETSVACNTVPQVYTNYEVAQQSYTGDGANQQSYAGYAPGYNASNMSTPTYGYYKAPQVMAGNQYIAQVTPVQTMGQYSAYGTAANVAKESPYDFFGLARPASAYEA